MGAAFIACPGVDDEVRRSPRLIVPFSSTTLQGTRPQRAIGKRRSCSPLDADADADGSQSASTKPGSTDTTPQSSGSFAAVDRTIPSASGAKHTTSPATSAWSDPY